MIEWTELEDCDEPIGLDELAKLSFSEMPESISLWICDNNFPEVFLQRIGSKLVCQIQEHMYSKYWQHKFSVYAFSAAMRQAVLRLQDEGLPLSEPKVDDSDVHVFVSWNLELPATTSCQILIDSVDAAYEIVYRRTNSILENSDSVLVLGPDSGEAMTLLKAISQQLERKGYFVYIIKEQPDKLGESVIQKVMRYALICKFVIVENSQASGHLYEFPHVAKMAECVTAVIQKEGQGATWMFEDGFAKHQHWNKFLYKLEDLESAIDAASSWAESYIMQFGSFQKQRLPWMSDRDAK